MTPICMRCQDDLVTLKEVHEEMCCVCSSHFEDVERKTDNWDIEPLERGKCIFCFQWPDDCQCEGGCNG